MDSEEAYPVDIEFVKTMGENERRVEPYSGPEWRENPGTFETSDIVYKITDLDEMTNYKNLYEDDSESSLRMRKILPKVYNFLIFDDEEGSSQDQSEKKYPNPFADHPRWSRGNKAVKGVMVMENLFKGFNTISFLDCKMGTKTGPKFKHKKYVFTC